MGDIAELVAVIFIGGFYCVSFLTVAALTEAAYMLAERLRRK